MACPSALASYSQAVNPCLTSVNPKFLGYQKQAYTKNFFNTLRATQILLLGPLKPIYHAHKHNLALSFQPWPKNHPALTTSEDEGNLETLSVDCYLDQIKVCRA